MCILVVNWRGLRYFRSISFSSTLLVVDILFADDCFFEKRNARQPLVCAWRLPRARCFPLPVGCVFGCLLSIVFSPFLRQQACHRLTAYHTCRRRIFYPSSGVSGSREPISCVFHSTVLDGKRKKMMKNKNWENIKKRQLNTGKGKKKGEKIRKLVTARNTYE